MTGIIDETDYIKYSKKFLSEKKQLEKNIEYLNRKTNSTEKTIISNLEVSEMTKHFLQVEYINTEILFELINRIEIDENKNVYIYFNFEQPK